MFSSPVHARPVLGIRRFSRPVVVGALSLALGAAATVGASPAAAASTWPGKPAGVRVSAAGSTYLTVSLRAAVHARSYRLYTSTSKPDIYYANLVHGHASTARRTATASRPAITISGYRYTTAPIYYRVVALNGKKASYSAGIGQTNLRPGNPAALTTHTSSSGTYLTWTSGAASGFTVAQATNAAMTAGRHSYPISDRSRQFTPYGLVKGTRYYFTIRALNGAMPSHYAPVVSVVAQAREQSIRIMSYNVLHLMFDGTRAGGNIVAPWSQRRLAAASLISSVDPDVVGVQEANDWANAAKTSRQVDSLRSALAGYGRNYTVAHTEALVTEPEYRANGYLRTGDYILYKPSVYRAVGLGGTWKLATKVYAAYQVLQNISSGAEVLVVNTHLTQPGGRANDLARAAETRTMIAQAAKLHLPVVYVGDYNSNTNAKQYTQDGPGDTMRAAHIADARLVAQSRINPHYDSANDYMRAPYHYDLYIDYLWLSAGVSASQWGMAMRLSHGRFVGVIPSDHNPIWAQLRYSY